MIRAHRRRFAYARLSLAYEVTFAPAAMIRTASRSPTASPHGPQRCSWGSGLPWPPLAALAGRVQVGMAATCPPFMLTVPTAICL